MFLPFGLSQDPIMGISAINLLEEMPDEQEKLREERENNGRNFEYMSGEDPYIGATLAPHAIRGIQSKGVIANGASNPTLHTYVRMPAAIDFSH